ncbi:MFS transporter [Streptomyces kronopolitis]|uniref:MFS transporter n=1 Tax=Streptomyces kronopolitis TaxID=1612435 RepID=A0ABQ2JNS7_9ACTN|nr:MFS transporter [Streptomyces kronopolitis]GGN48994.1 MFS transporter [Streptomyces kronopolitis]
MMEKTLPARSMSRAWIGRYSLAWLGLWMAYLVPQQFALPDQLARVDPAGRIADFGVINAVCGIVALFTLPLFGTLCDRTRSRFGRRRLWVAGGATLFASGLVATGLQSDWIGIGLSWLVCSIGFCMATVGFTALVADQVPEAQRATVSSAMFGPQTIGVVLGLFCLTAITGDLLRYLLLAAGVLVLTAPFVLKHRDTATTRPDGGVGLREFVASVRDNPAFAWIFGTRVLMNLANALATSYQLYFITDVLRVAHPEQLLLLLTMVYLAWTLVSVYVCGVLSDRLGRRRVFVACGATLQALGCAAVAIAPSTASALVATSLLGVGVGAFLAVDQAIITAVLPAAENRARDLGIMNIGLFGPQTLGPLLAGLVIDGLGGYQVLFALAGATSLVSGLLIYRVSSVR